QGTEFNSEEQVWVWMYDENEMFMDIDESIRFRVESEQFFDTSPSVRPKKEGVDTPDLSANSTKQAPYSLVVSRKKVESMKANYVKQLIGIN
ncbi:hypothetical protein BX616_011096, partial [Lobosporangium transversale]